MLILTLAKAVKINLQLFYSFITYCIYLYLSTNHIPLGIITRRAYTCLIQREVSFRRARIIPCLSPAQSLKRSVSDSKRLSVYNWNVFFSFSILLAWLMIGEDEHLMKLCEQKGCDRSSPWNNLVLGGRRVNSGILSQPVDSMILSTPKGSGLHDSGTRGLFCTFRALSSRAWPRPQFLCPLDLIWASWSSARLLCTDLFSCSGWIFITLKWWLFSACPYHHHTARIPSRTFFTLLCAFISSFLFILMSTWIQPSRVTRKSWEGEKGQCFIPLPPFASGLGPGMGGSLSL